MAKQKITDIVAEVLEEFLSENGYELYNIEFVKEGKDWFLRVFVDMQEKDAYIGTEDCEKISRFLSQKLDEKDPIEQNYYLEVSSPGMDRALIKDSDYEKYAGHLVEASLYQAIDGVKKIEGTLQGIKDQTIVIIDKDGKAWELPRQQVAKTKLVVVF